jgi:hypothetical protein
MARPGRINKRRSAGPMRVSATKGAEAAERPLRVVIGASASGAARSTRRPAKGPLARGFGRSPGIGRLDGMAIHLPPPIDPRTAPPATTRDAADPPGRRMKGLPE